jgi:hypothetical protein
LQSFGRMTEVKSLRMIVEKYQVAGLDERERGFNRLVELEQVAGQYRARFQYETTIVITEAQDSSGRALLDLIRLLQDRGYTQLRSQLSFRGSSYLGTVEPWTEHPDRVAKDGGPENLGRVWAKITGWLSRARTASG